MFKKQTVLRSEKSALKKKKKNKILIISLSLVAFLFLILIPTVTHLPFIKISKVNIVGAELISKEEVESLVKADLKGNYAFIFSKANAFIYPDNLILKNLKETFPEISKVEVLREDLKTLQVTIVEREPMALWCDDSVESLCFFVDEKGEIYSKAPQFSQGAYIRFREGVDPPGLGQFIFKDNFLEVLNFAKKVKSLDLPITYIIPRVEDEDYDIHISGGGKIIFSLREDLSAVSERLEYYLKDKNSVKSLSEFIKNLDYLDLRFGKKLFLKEKEAMVE
jgi:hypothetical protein